MQRTAAVVASIAIGLSTLAPLPAVAVTDLPPVIVRGTYVGGGNVICRGESCAGVLRALSGMDIPLSPEQGPLIDPEPVHKPQFCAHVKAAKPPNCGGTPPSVPGYDPGWMANGCGDGSFKVTIASEVAKLVVPNYTGSLDHPLPSVSFFGACTAHDACYGAATSKQVCDSMFDVHMQNACSFAPGYAAQCSSLRSAYRTSVQSFGQPAYNAAQAARSCAAWHHDMEANGCPK